MTELTRIGMAARYSEAAIFNGIVFLAGQVPEKTLAANIEAQTEEVLGLIEQLLGENGSDKSRILMCQIFLADLADFDGMNRVWDAWVARPRPTTRDCRGEIGQPRVPHRDSRHRSAADVKAVSARDLIDVRRHGVWRVHLWSREAFAPPKANLSLRTLCLCVYSSSEELPNTEARGRRER